jgi:hypothetical protein
MATIIGSRFWRADFVDIMAVRFWNVVLFVALVAFEREAAQLAQLAGQ